MRSGVLKNSHEAAEYSIGKGLNWTKQGTCVDEGIMMEEQNKNIRIDKGGKYLTFTLADEDYGIEILKVKEIIGMMPITTLPQTPEFC